MSVTKTSARVGDMVASLEERLKAAQVRFSVARDRLGAISLEKVEDPSGVNSESLIEARKHLSQAQQEVEEAEAVLLASRSKHAAVLAAEQAAEDARRWEVAAAIGREFLAACADYERRMLKAIRTGDRVTELAAQMYEAAPRRDARLGSSDLSGQALHAYMKVYCQKVGLQFLGRNIWGSDKFPSLLEKGQEATAWLLKEHSPAFESVAAEPKPVRRNNRRSSAQMGPV